MIAEELPCQTSLSLHFGGDYTNKIGQYYEDLKSSILTTKASEMTESFLNKHLLNSKYSKLSFLDFSSFDGLLRKRREQDLMYWTESDFKEYKKIILNGVRQGSLPPPVILRDIEGKLLLFSGEARLLAYKVLGIQPFVKIIDIDDVLLPDNA